MSVVENIQNVRAKIAAAVEKKRQNGGGRTSVGSQQDKACGADWRGGAGRGVFFSGRKQGAGNHGKI